MTIPVWFHILWMLAASACGVACVLLFRFGRVRQWPALFALCANDVLFTVAAELNPPGHHHYFRYFWMYWIDSAISSLILVWLALNVVHAMPSSRFFPGSFKTWTVIGTTLAGALWVYWTSPRFTEPVEDLVKLLKRSVNFTWSAMAVVVIICIASAGFGYSRLGVRIASGALSRLMAALFVSYFLPMAATGSLTLRLLDSLETTVALWSGCYWIYALLRASGDERANARLWHEAHTIPAAEKDGYL